MKRATLFGTLIVMTAILALVGCQMFDESPTEVAAPGAGLNQDFIMGTPEVDGWGAYYQSGGSFVRVDIPVIGAVKIDYNTTSGWRGAIFGSAGSPMGVEIGVKEGDTIDSVCVSYVEGAGFSSMPSNVEEKVKGDWTHYTRLADDGTSDWWPTDAAFAFSGDTLSACGVVDSEVQWEEISGGAFDKPQTTTPATPATPVCAAGSFRDNGDGTVTQCGTGKMWEQDANAAGTWMNWTAAESRCNSLTTGGYSDWRLPKPSELMDELYDGGISPGTPSPFVNVQSFYWGTATDDPPSYTGLPAYNSWYVFLSNGSVNVGHQANTLFVWCVRG